MHLLTAGQNRRRSSKSCPGFFFRLVPKNAKGDYWLHVPVRIQLGFHWTDFLEIQCLNSCRKYAEKIQVSLKFDNNNG